MVARTVQKAEFCLDPTKTGPIKVVGAWDDLEGNDMFRQVVHIIIKGDVIRKEGFAADGRVEGEIVGRSVELTLSPEAALHLAEQLTLYAKTAG